LEKGGVFAGSSHNYDLNGCDFKFKLHPDCTW
jgi:hypothetical protein